MSIRQLTGLVPALFLCGCAASSSGKAGRADSPASAAKMKVAAPTPGSAKLYRGPEGLVVEQIKLEDDTYLMRIQGADSVIAGKVLPYERQQASNPVLVTRLNGREFWVLHTSNRGGEMQYQLYVPYDSLRQGIYVSYDEEKSKTLQAQPLVDAYRAVLADGSLAELQRFKRDKEQGEEQKGFDDELTQMNEACGSTVRGEVDWSTVSDETLLKLSIASYCSGPADALRQMCKASAGMRELVAKQLKRIRCSFRAERSIALSGDTIDWVTADGATNMTEYARDYLMAKARWKSAKNPAELAYLENTEICSDGKTVFVGRHPDRAPGDIGSNYGKRIFFGNGKSFTRVPPQKDLGGDWFFDPRFFVASHNANLRGIDYRFHSRFEIDAGKGTCQLICGERVHPLKLLPPTQVASLMQTPFQEVSDRRVPYGLARDRRGIYYYVDRGAAPDAKDYQLYRGPVGKLRPMKMTNIVSDTEGDVFSTRSGSLRLVLEQSHSYWIQGGKRRTLLNVPIHDNLQLIYNELGLYLGRPFGTPCDLM